MSQVRLSFQAVQVQSTGAPPSEDGLPASVDSSTSSRGCAGCPLWASALQTPAQVHFTCMFPEIVQVRSALTLTPFMATPGAVLSAVEPPPSTWTRHSCHAGSFVVQNFVQTSLQPVLPSQAPPSHKQWCFKAIQKRQFRLVVHLWVTFWLSPWFSGPHPRHSKNRRPGPI